MDRNAPMTIPELGLLDFIGFLREPPVWNILLYYSKTKAFPRASMHQPAPYGITQDL